MKQTVLVDACNVIHAVEPFKDRLAEGMDTLAGELLECLLPLHDFEDWELHLIVDGRGSHLDKQFQNAARTVSIIFSPEGKTADTVIESWLMRLGPDWSVRVVTGDRAISHTALACKAEPISPFDAMDWAQRVRERFSRQQQNKAKKSSSSFGNRLEGLP
jgi:predicted RNA-binding protein with PIN domain